MTACERDREGENEREKKSKIGNAQFCCTTPREPGDAFTLSVSCSSSGLLQGHTCTNEHRATHKHTLQTCRHCHSWQLVIYGSGSSKEEKERWKRIPLSHYPVCPIPLQLKQEAQPLNLAYHAAHHVKRCRLLEDNIRALNLELATLRQQKQQHQSLESEVNDCRKRCQILEREVKNKTLECETLKNELQDALLERKRLNRELLSHILRATKYEKVISCVSLSSASIMSQYYDRLRKAFGCVSQEKDSARQEKAQLQDKLENLEQVLKHMREAADRRHQLEAEHEQALAFLNSRQQEITLLQKVQAEAGEEVVHLLEVKVHDFEHKCRTWSEQCNILSKELGKYHLGSDAEETLNTDSQKKNLCNSYNSLQRKAEKSDERSDGSPLVSELPIVQQHKREKPEQLSVKPTIQTQSRSSSPMQASLSEMENEVSPAPRSKTRYTGQVRLCTARYSYNPYDGPNEHPEAELPLVAGKYLYVYGDMDDDGFYEGELLDGQRGLVPSNFVEFVQDKEKPSIEGGEEQGRLEQSCLSLMTIDGGAHLDSLSSNALANCTNGTGALDGEELGDDIVPYPRKINLIKQLARSVIVAWEAPLVPLGWGNINGYNILVDGEVRSSVPFGGRTKLLLEKLDLASCTYRVSVQSVTDRGLSNELRCTLLVGCNVVVAPTGLRMDDILRDSAELSWLPSNSNYAHVVYLDGVEHAVVKPCSYKLRFVNLKAATVYKVKVLAKPHQVPWHMPLEQREKREAGVEFCTQAAGPPLPPQEVQVQCGQAPGVLQVRWKPPPMTTMGTSNGAYVIGYAVCTKGQRIAEVMYPLADYVAVELNRLQCLEAHEVIVKTLSAQGESQDSHAAIIPNHLLVPLPKTLPPSHHMPQQSQPMPPHPQIHTLPPHPGPQPPTHLQTLPIHPNQPPSHLHPHRVPHPTQPSPPHLQPLPTHPIPMPQPQSSMPMTQPPPQPPMPMPQPQQPMPQPQPAIPMLQPQPTIPMPQPHIPHLALPQSQRPLSARELETKEQGPGMLHHGGGPPQPWEPGCSPSGLHTGLPHGHTLDAPACPNRRSPSPQRILPQPRGTLIPDTVAKAIAREAAQRVAAESGRIERRSQGFHSQNSDEEEDEDEESYQARRRGASMDDFLRGSELGRQSHYSHSEEYHTDSSRGSDLSDIMEEDEEELYYEMQHEERRRRNSHNAPKTRASTPSSSQLDRESYRKPSHRDPQPQRQPLTVPSIGQCSPNGYRDRSCRSPPYYDESEQEDLFRIFVALFDYDPLSMSPNPDAADEELPFKEGHIIKVYGDKDNDGFYRGEIRGRSGLIPCNMVSEICAEDDETMEQLMKQGFLPLNTPVDRIEQNRRGRHPVATRRMVALYDYDPRESSPNVDVEAELTFCAGDILAVFGDIDEDGFYYGELNGHRGLVPSNFLEEVPDDVEVYLTDTPSHHGQDEPNPVLAPRPDTKRKYCPFPILAGFCLAR
ncbi:RIMS-binding protein 2 isoform X5 [Carassius carassius]|uniref:RIMS-binding protein 2 isoform X5 n=1 Tax=Carassius carassius TaxID=217509 RepID=UPI002868F9C9|nr:RIMS-binding protein 2 isoform X5 [Carassius carassius]